MSDSSLKIPSADKLGVVLSMLCMLVALVMAIAMRSWSPLVFFSGFLVAITIVQGSVGSLLAIHAKQQSWSAFTPVHVVVAISAVIFILVGMVSFAERIVWYNAGSIPSLLVVKNYGDRYTPNKHRMLKVACEVRGGGPMFLREIGESVYARCGEWFPQGYTISASRTAFQNAVSETIGDKPGMGFEIEPDE